MCLNGIKIHILEEHYCPFMNIRGFLGEVETTKAYIVDTIIGKIGAICDHPLEIVVEVSSFYCC